MAAETNGWDFSISREALGIYDLFDLTVRANTDPKKGKPKPHPGRPFTATEAIKKRRGDAAGRTPDQVKEILRRSREGTLQAPV